MASSLQALRKAAGYRSAKDFAARMDIPEATYARYEREPEKIPTANAWRLADELGATIDAVVGRKAPEPQEPPQDEPRPADDLRRAYDALTPESKLTVERFVGYLGHMEAIEGARRKADADRRYDAAAYRYEQLFMASIEEGADFADLAAFGTPEEMRGRFEAFVEARAAEKRATAGKAGDEEAAERDREAVARIMEAYDRNHETYRFGDGRVMFCSAMDMGNPYLAVEFDSGAAGKEGGI